MATTNVMKKTKHVGANFEYYILELDAGGFPTQASIELGAILRQEVLSKQYTDVVFLSHGWTTTRQDDGSILSMNMNVEQMEARKPEDARILYIAVKWPSAVPTVFSRSPYKNAKEFFTEIMSQIKAITVESDERAEDTTTKGRKVGEATKAADECIELLNRFFEVDNEDDDETLPEEVRGSLAKLANKINEQSACSRGDSESLLDDGDKYGTVTSVSVERIYQRVRTNNLSPNWREELKKQETDNAQEQTVATRSFSVGRVFKHTLRAFNLAATIFDVLFGTFERRAAIVGSRGVHWAISDLMKHAPEETKFHLFGHSLGGHVVLAAAIGRAPGSAFTRKLHSVFIAQGACPTDVFKTGNPYRPIASKLKPVAGPISATTWDGDAALKGYDVFLPRPAGIFGFDKSNPLGLQRIVLDKRNADGPKQQEEFKKATIYNLHSSAIIDDHTVVNQHELMDMFWQAARVDLDRNDYQMTDPASLPDSYWNDYGIRVERRTCLGFVGCSIM